MVLIKRGFSLIELVVVVGLLTLLMLAISSTMLMSIVSSKKLRNTVQVKQAGNYVLGQIQAMLQSAKSIESCDSTSHLITFTNLDGGSTVLTTELDDNGQTRIASGSGNYLTPDNLALDSFNLSCYPDDTTPKLVKLSFNLTGIHFETSVSLRNE